MKGKGLKWTLIALISVLIIGGSVVFYLFNMPHRDVQALNVDYTMSSTELVKEYLQNTDEANKKYLQEEGESKIIAVSGIVESMEEDLNLQKVILLKASGDKAGVSCTFTESSNMNAMKLKKGDKVTVKGVIRSGAGYDEDLELYEDVIMEKCDIYK